jgi:hypothetical protein
MFNNETFIEKLEKQIDDLYPVIDILMNNSSVYYHNTNGDHGTYYSVGAPIYHYSKRDEKTQIIAKEKYFKFLENIELLLSKANANTLRNIKKTEKDILNFIEQRNAPASIEGGKMGFKDDILIFKQFLELLKKDKSEILIIPDTNAIIQYPDPKSYNKLISAPFSFVILPTVLSGLDKLKVNHRNEEFRDKAKSVIKRLKGFR